MTRPRPRAVDRLCAGRRGFTSQRARWLWALLPTLLWTVILCGGPPAAHARRSGLMRGGHGPGRHSRIAVGFNLDPRWLEHGTPFGKMLQRLRRAGLRALEFPLDPGSPRWSQTSTLIAESRSLGFKTVLHLPYKSPYNPVGFAEEKQAELKALYRPLFGEAAGLARRAGPITVVIHAPSAAEHVPGTKPALRADTEAFLRWVTTEYRGLRPVLELLPPRPEMVRIGETKAEVLEMIDSVHSSRLDGCWDLGHDALGGSTPASPAFVRRTGHVHVHDIAPDGADHAPLRYGNVPFERSLRRLTLGGYRGVVTLEVKGKEVFRYAAASGTDPLTVVAEDIRRLRRLTRGR